MRIDPEFKKLIPPLVPDEKDRLRANLKQDGCRDALVVWKEEDILLDGHNRLEICEEEGIEYRTATISLPDRTAAEIWILENQAGRRNLNVSQFAILAVDLKKLYAVEAKKRQLVGLVQYSDVQKYSDVQNDTSVPADSAGTGGIGRESRERAAEKYNISPRSVESASVVKKRGVPELFDAVKAGEVTVSAAEMVSRLTPESQRKVLTAGADARPRSVRLRRRASHDLPRRSPGGSPLVESIPKREGELSGPTG